MKKITKIWFGLLALTVFAFLLGYFKVQNSFFIFLLLGTTFIKGQLIVDFFMNLSEVQLKYRLLPILWLALVIGLIALAYFLPTE